jgi:hypothetical protein
MCSGVFALLASVDFRLQIITTAGGVSRIKITFRILKNGRTQQYMQESLTFQICFLAISGTSPLQNSNEPFYKTASSFPLNTSTRIIKPLLRKRP